VSLRACVCVCACAVLCVLPCHQLAKLDSSLALSGALFVGPDGAAMEAKLAQVCYRYDDYVYDDGRR
jgi:hypothetical protein